MAFNQLFWGFVFQFDFRINRFDLLPDFIGYLFFLSGLTKLAARSVHFAVAKRRVLPLLVLSLPSIYEIRLQDGFSLWTIAAVIFFLVTLVLDLSMVFGICRGIEELASRQLQLPLAEKAIFRRQLYLANSLIMPFLLLLFQVVPTLAFALFVPMFAFSLIVLLLMLGLMQSAGSQLDGSNYFRHP